LTVFWATCLFT